MAVSTDPSTFEFAAYWLVSSECFVRDCMLRDEATPEEARAAALARIHREEIIAEPDLASESEAAPDPPPPIDARPRSLIEKTSDRRELAGTGTWRGSGQLEITVEIPMPLEFRRAAEDTQAVWVAKFKAFRIWCDQLVSTLRSELYAESGRADEAGNPYLNATTIDIEAKPFDQEVQEQEPFVAFTLGVEWR